MAVDDGLALERVMGRGDEWQSWRALRIAGEDGGPIPSIPGQDELGGFVGPGGRTSPGATGEAICHLVMLDLGGSPAAVIAADFLEENRTPANAWLDAPDEVPGDLDTAAGGRVWATASATCALLALGRDPGSRALDLLRGEADLEGRFTGGGYPTYAAAAAYWQAEGPKTETAEWALRWARERVDEWGPWEHVTALTFWSAAGIPAEHMTIEAFADTLRSGAPGAGWDDDTELTLRSLEALSRYGL